MKKILTRFFVTLGIVFFVSILGGVYFFITDPYNLKPLIFGTGQKKTPVENVDTSVETETPSTPGAGGFQLSDTQRRALESFGIDPATVPTSISAEQEACFNAVLGTSRVAEIKAGDSPSALEFVKAKSCI